MIEPRRASRRAAASSSRPGTAERYAEAGVPAAVRAGQSQPLASAARCAGLHYQVEQAAGQAGPRAPRARSSTSRWISGGARPPSDGGSAVTLSDREPPAALDPARLRPRLLRAERRRRRRVQVHRPYAPARERVDPLGRPRPGHRLAAAKAEPRSSRPRTPPGSPSATPRPAGEPGPRAGRAPHRRWRTARSGVAGHGAAGLAGRSPATPRRST